jgi:hypothetical protein
MCSLNLMPGSALASTDASVALADFERIAPKVVAVQFDQVEGIEECLAVMPSVADAVEGRDAAVVASDSFAIDDAGARA